jgi:hypothetical protein
MIRFPQQTEGTDIPSQQTGSTTLAIASRGGSLDKQQTIQQQQNGGGNGGHQSSGSGPRFGPIGGHASHSFEPIQRGTFINPFRPEEFIVRITANRRRWIHVFPVDRLGRNILTYFKQLFNTTF